VRFTEINLFGVYGAPMSLMMVVSRVATIGLRWFAARFGLPQYVLPGNAIGWTYPGFVER
jgi:protein AaeX